MKRFFNDKYKGKVLAVASFGGHETQLRCLLDNIVSQDFTYVSTVCDESHGERSFIVRDCNMKTPFSFLVCFIESLVIFLKVRPEVVVTTGALPGLSFVILARLFFKKSIWIDSIANADKLSFSGKVAKYIATICLTQWKSIEDGNRVLYKGSIL